MWKRNEPVPVPVLTLWSQHQITGVTIGVATGAESGSTTRVYHAPLPGDSSPAGFCQLVRRHSHRTSQRAAVSHCAPREVTLCVCDHRWPLPTANSPQPPAFSRAPAPLCLLPLCLSPSSASSQHFCPLFLTVPCSAPAPNHNHGSNQFDGPLLDLSELRGLQVTTRATTPTAQTNSKRRTGSMLPRTAVTATTVHCDFRGGSRQRG
jgi:hypothetical protein